MWKTIFVIINAVQFAAGSNKNPDTPGIIIEEVCVPHQIAELERYLKEFDSPEVPISNTATYHHLNIDVSAVAELGKISAAPFTDANEIELLPLGALTMDLKRLRILQDLLILPEDAELKSKLTILYKILIAANQRAKKSFSKNSKIYTSSQDTQTQKINAAKNTPNYLGDEKIDAFGSENGEKRNFLTTIRQRPERSTYNQNYDRISSSVSSSIGTETTLNFERTSDPQENVNFYNENLNRDTEISGKSNFGLKIDIPKIDEGHKIFRENESGREIKEFAGVVTRTDNQEFENADLSTKEIAKDSNFKEINTDIILKSTRTDLILLENTTDLDSKETTPRSNFKVIVTDSNFKENVTADSESNETTTSSNFDKNIIDSKLKTTVTYLNFEENVTNSILKKDVTDSTLKATTKSSNFEEIVTDLNSKETTTAPNVEKIVTNFNFEANVTDLDFIKITTTSNIEEHVNPNFQTAVTAGPNSKENFTVSNLKEIVRSSNFKEGITDSNFGNTVTNSDLRESVTSSNFEEIFTDSNFKELVTSKNPIKSSSEYPTSKLYSGELIPLKNQHSKEVDNKLIKGKAYDYPESEVTGFENRKSSESHVASETINEMRSPSPEGKVTTKEIKPDVRNEDLETTITTLSDPFIRSSSLLPIDQKNPRYFTFQDESSSSHRHFTTPLPYLNDKISKIFNYNEGLNNHKKKEPKFYTPAVSKIEEDFFIFPTTRRTFILNVAESFSNIPRPVEIAIKKKDQKISNHISKVRNYEDEKYSRINSHLQNKGFYDRNKNRVEESREKFSGNKLYGSQNFGRNRSTQRHQKRGGHNTDVQKLYRWFYRGGEIPENSAPRGAEVKCERKVSVID